MSAGAAYGAALLGGVAAGVYADAAEAIATCVQITDTTEPDPDLVARYAEIVPRFRELYPALRPLT